MKTKIFLIILLLLVIASIVTFVVLKNISMNEISQRSIIGSEMEKINNYGIIDTEIKSSGKYAEVEKALKDYILEYQNITNDISTAYENESITTILSANNYKADGPNFLESKQLINSLMSKGKNAKAKFGEMHTDEYKDKRADECGLSGKYKDLFVNSIQLEDDLNNIESTIDDVNNYLSKIEDVLDFLIETKDNWSIVDNQIEFEEETQISEYNSLLLEVSNASEKLQ